MAFQTAFASGYCFSVATLGITIGVLSNISLSHAVELSAQNIPQPTTKTTIDRSRRSNSKTLNTLPQSKRWLSHVKRDLIPFYDQPGALGYPLGKFPAVRCNNGKTVDYSNPCSEVAGYGYLLENRHYTLTISRQVYAYGVAFHLTGHPKYLRYAKAGVDYLRKYAFDHVQGGIHSYFDNRSQSWGPSPGLRNTQELAYALLGMSFYHYLTRDAAVLKDIKLAKNHIFNRYYNSDLQAIQWQLQDGNGRRALEKRFVAQIDQLGYLFLVTPDLPAPLRREWTSDIERVVNTMLRDFYSPQENLFALEGRSDSNRDSNSNEIDFGHTAKGLWMMAVAGRMTGTSNWINFARQKGPQLLQRAYLPQEGAWATGIRAGGSIDGEKSWWIYAELDQLASLLALQDAQQTKYLARTYHYWLNQFVDKQQGEVWTQIAAGSNQPIGLPKAWPWKNGYHSFEHALFAYITTSQSERKPIRLFYAFQQHADNASMRPYLFTGKVQSVSEQSNPNGGKIYRVVFSDLDF